MSTPGSGNGPDDRDDTWTSETLPMSLRRELLERELDKLGFRKVEAASRGAAQQQQQGAAGASAHPQADGDTGNHSS